MLKRMEDQVQQTINDAVKRALANQAGQGPSTKRQKKEPEFKSKGNQLRYEANGDILQTVEAAIKAIDNKQNLKKVNVLLLSNRNLSESQIARTMGGKLSNIIYLG